MTPLAFSPERRAELADLLGDERRLEAEYPAVAEYLDAAPSLPGSGDDAADREFDLRMLHFLTGGRAVSGNPYWDIVAPAVFREGSRRVVNGGKSTGSARMAYAQTVLQAAYAYAIPSPETVRWIAHFCNDLPVIETGAGRGYWAWQLAQAGLKVEAYDVEPPGRSQNLSFPRVAGQLDAWSDVLGTEEFTGRIAENSDAVLFLCWPPGWGNAMASDALAAFEDAGGKRLIYIGESQGGKTANDQFFTALAQRWKMVSADEAFVSWWNLSDSAQGWTRR